MRINPRSKNVKTNEAFRAHVTRRLEFGLGRFEDHIREASLRIEDLNGPRGGVDKLCQLEIRLDGRGTVRIEETGADLIATIDRATDRAGATVARTVGRTKPQRFVPRMPAFQAE